MNLEKLQLIRIEISEMPLVIENELTKGKYRIEVDESKEVYFKIDDVTYYFYIFKADNLWFTNSKVLHLYQLNKNIEKERCPFCSDKLKERSWDLPCDVLSNKINEIIRYMKEKGSSRVKMIYELSGKFLDFDDAMERIGFVYDGEIEEWVQVYDEDEID